MVRDTNKYNCIYVCVCVCMFINMCVCMYEMNIEINFPEETGMCMYICMCVLYVCMNKMNIETNFPELRGIMGKGSKNRRQWGMGETLLMCIR